MKHSSHSLYDSASREKSVSFESSALRNRTPDKLRSSIGSSSGPGYSPSRYSITSPKFVSPLYQPSYGTPSSNRISHLDSTPTSSSASKYQLLHSEFDLASRSVSNVITAFRELQVKSRNIENDRFSAINERDELRAKIAEMQRNFSMFRSQRASENLMQARREGDKVKSQLGNIEEKLMSEEDVSRALQRGITARSTIIVTHENDVKQIDHRLQKLRQTRTVLSQDLETAENRCERLAGDITEVREKHQYKCNALRESINDTQKELLQADRSLDRSSVRLNAMSKYLELILSINGDLCETLSAREQAKSRILKLAGKYAPPRYSWPKRTSHPKMENVLEVISDAATASALEQRASDSVANLSKSLKKTKLASAASAASSLSMKTSIKSKKSKAASMASASSLSLGTNDFDSVSEDSLSYNGSKKKYNFNAQLRSLRPKSAPQPTTMSSIIKKPQLNFKNKLSVGSTTNQGNVNGNVRGINRSNAAGHTSPGRLVEQRAAAVVAAVALSNHGFDITTGRLSTSPLRYSSPKPGVGVTPEGGAFIPASGNSGSKEFNSLARESANSRDNLQKFAVFASK